MKLILVYMLTYTGGDKDTCFPSIRTIAEDLNMSTTTVTRYIKEACERKFISKSKLNDNPMNHANKYKMLIMKHDVSTYKNIDVSPSVTPKPPKNGTTMYHPVSQNNTNVNNTMNTKNPPKRRQPPPSPDERNKKYLPLAKLLYSEDEKTAVYIPSCKSLDKKMDSWAKEIRLIFENDKKKVLTFEIMEGVIKWCKNPDNFPGTFSWVPNIRSGAKLRKHFGQLLQQYRQWQKQEEERKKEEELDRRVEYYKARGL